MPYNHQSFDVQRSMGTKQFEIYHYQDRNMENVNVHHHNFYEVYFFISGEVRFRIEGRTYILEPGDLLLINPQQLHQSEIGPDSTYERIVLWLDRNYLASLSCPGMDLTGCFDPNRPNYTNLVRASKGQRASLRQLLEHLTQEFHSQSPGHELYAQGVLLQFLVELNRLAAANSPFVPGQQEPDLVARVLGYIGNHYMEKISLDTIATEFYVSKYYLSHAFSRQVGTSIYRYILFRRLSQAKELMIRGQTPGEIYQQCGFGDYANFYRAFKETFGISPRAFAADTLK